MSNHGSYHSISSTLQAIESSSIYENFHKYFYYQNAYNNRIGIIYLVISALFSGIGNSLESVSMLSWLSTVLLILGIEITIINYNNDIDKSSMVSNSISYETNNTNDIHINKRQLYKMLLLIWITQSIGFVIGFSTIFAFPNLTIISILSTFLFGLGLWFIIITLAIIPYIYFKQKYYNSIISIFIYPLIQTTITYSLIGLIFSTFTMVGNSSLDYEPLRQVGSILGIEGINFIFLFTASLVSYSILKPKFSIQISLILILLLVFFSITGLLYQSDSLYQKDINNEIIENPYIPVSCVFGHSIKRDSIEWNIIWNSIKQRVLSGDKIIMMSEESLEIYSQEDEVSIIQQAQTIANMKHDEELPVYIGLSYLKFYSTISNIGTNHFTLISSTSLLNISNDNTNIIWNYKKANPVPIVESNIQAGPKRMPIHQSSYGILSGAICFDLDYPQYIAQQQQHYQQYVGSELEHSSIDILLQPSWTWKAINYRHFDGNSIRAIENGFTLFRCSSDGESGIINHKGKILTRKYTGHDPSIVATFSLPIHKSKYNHITLYRYGFGFVFEYLCICLSILCILLSIIPREYLFKSINKYFPRSVAIYINLLLLNRNNIFMEII